MAASIITSIITGGSNSHATTSYEANAFATDFITQGVVGSIANTLGVSPATGAFAVNAQGTPAMFVDVTAGVAYISATPASQAAQVLRAYMSATSTSYVISANASGSTKYDWIYLKVDATKAGGTEDAAADDITALYTSRSSSNTVDNNAPPTYGILLAVITVANGASSITNANILDSRAQAAPSAQVSSSGTGWTASTAPTSTSYLGNRSYQITVNSTDLTGSLSPGMRVRATRTVAPPTQCTSLNGSSQYFNKTSPAGMTFTDDFVVSAWVKVTSYSACAIASRYNGTSGWSFEMGATGQVTLSGVNGGASNFSQVVSTQSLPLNRWVHIAAQLDMSTFTATPTTSYMMIDGVDVQATVARGGTNPTALIQAGNLEVGSRNGGTFFFPGKIAQLAIFNAKVTQATIRGYVSQTMTGAETSTISVYSFNNTINDLNANANNLTAQGSALATNADSPYSGAVATGIDFGAITAITFATNTTITASVPDGYAFPTTGGISALSYSTAANPFGFPAISRFKLSAFDTSGTLANPLLALMVQYILNKPIDNVIFNNTGGGGSGGNAGGSMYLEVDGATRRISGLTPSLTGAASSTYGVNLPTGFFTTVEAGSIGVGRFGTDYGCKAGFDTSMPTTTQAVIAMIGSGANTGAAFYIVTGT